MRQTERSAPGCAALILAATHFGQAASAQDPGAEWQSLTSEQSRIVFVAPGLEDQRVRYMRSVALDRRSTVEIAIWTGPVVRHAKAAVTFIELSAGQRFPGRLDPIHLIVETPSFKDKALEFRGLKRDGNRIGTIESRRFVFDDVQCLVFAQYWGESAGDRGSAGTSRLSGYYCADPGRPLTSGLRKAVIRGLGIKGKAVPPAGPALPLQVWLEKPGRPKGLYFGKLFVSEGAGEGDLVFMLPMPYGGCEGRWTFRVGAGLAGARTELDWRVECANGQIATGDYEVSEAGRGQGVGWITDGARLSLEFGF